ncbi:hypothetical protein KKD61_01560 [Patescibacteria group bacterium]|nr:hypothetical protein [Patescibacteria group bacterium]
MNVEQNLISIKSFLFEGREQPVSFVETMHIVDGVDCDVYTFDGDSTKDLGIIRIVPGNKTPLQRVLKGDRTVEGYLSGKGKLTITKPDGKQQIYEVNEELKEPIVVTVAIGELMQWEADTSSNLKVYEICFPPYEDGRYENIK